jgi:N-acetylmuramoyl-L-alanine amidase
MFVSVHCNSSLSAQSQGFEVYILSPDATDQAAEAVARIENSVVALETKKGESSSKLSSLLASMAVYTFINESSKAAALICRGVKKRTTADKTAVKEANFHVLRGAQMPGVLVELGYLSHPISEIKLRSSRYTDSLASGVADGIMEYRQSLNGRKRASYRPPVKTVSRAAR